MINLMEDGAKVALKKHTHVTTRTNYFSTVMPVYYVTKTHLRRISQVLLMMEARYQRDE